MKITVTKKKEIEVELSDEQVDEIVARTLRNYYYDSSFHLTSREADALALVYHGLTGKNISLERPHGSS